MKVTHLPIKGLVVIEPKIFGDERGFFVETYNKDRYSTEGLEVEFVQDNLSYSKRGVLRGLHLQNPHSQGKLVSVIEGSIYDVAVDVRVGSPTFGESYGIELNSETKNQFYVPEGFAHGFVVTSETALFSYKCTDIYHPEAEISVKWNDPALKIDWPIENPQLSQKDIDGVCLADIDTSTLPVYSES